MNSVELSFCLPVYNVREYIEECIRSIQEQRTDSFEIICIDDCSEDESLAELVRLKDIYPEIRIVSENKNNEGPGRTRNKLIKAAKGKYIWFVDTDDLLVPLSAQMYYRIAEENEADMVLGNVCFFRDGDSSVTQRDETGSWCRTSFSDITNYYPHDQDGRISFGVWNGLFRRSFLTDQNVYFDEKMKQMEDVDFLFEAGSKANTIIRVDHYGYSYRIRERSSSVRKKEADYFKKRYLWSKYLLKKWNGYWHNPEVEKKAECHQVMKAHIDDRTRMALLALVRLSDRKFIQQELSILKQWGLYPYSIKSGIQLRQYKLSQRILINLLPAEPLFWIINRAYCCMKSVVEHTLKQKRERNPK